MRPRFFSTVSVLMLAAILYASLGPQVCRALMATDVVETAVKCCGDGTEPTAGAETPSGAHESCPLHRLSLIELLPAPSEIHPPDAPQTSADAHSEVVSIASLHQPISERCLAQDSSPPRSSSLTLFLLHRNIRR